MGRRLCLLLVMFSAAIAAAGDGSAQLEACNEERDDCRESCTIDYGTSLKLRAKLTRCIKKCSKKHSGCRGRTVELQDANIEIPENLPAHKEEPSRTIEKRSEVESVSAVADDAEEQPVEKAELPKVEQPEQLPEKKSRPAQVAAGSAKKVEAPFAAPEEKAIEKVADNPAKKVDARKAAPQPEPGKAKRKDLDLWDEGDIDR